MAQILVTVDEDMATQSIRKAIEMIKGVVSTRIYNKEEKEMTKRQQEHYVKESLTRAWGGDEISPSLEHSVTDIG